MKLRKYLSVILLCVSILLIVASGLCFGFAFGGNVGDNRCTVTFLSSEHVNYVIDGEEVDTAEKMVEKGGRVEFAVTVEEGFLENTVVVNAGNETLAATDGKYSLTVRGNISISASVTEDTLEGAGTSKDDPFRITSLKDLSFMADMVNSGNSTYVAGYYRLENDIDCGGAELKVIGAYDTQYAFFAGYLNGQNHTISNFRINTYEKAYVGLFGCVQTVGNADSGVIENLNLSNFNIRAVAANDGNVCVGAIAGFAAGANILACNVTDGEIHLNGSSYFSYAGGAVGIQQSLTVSDASNTATHYLSITEYIHTDVDIVATGYVYAAGGVVGYVFSSHERSVSAVLNSYADGTVNGAMRAGGVVGWLNDYSAVANCYASGYVSAAVSFPAAVTDPEYFAYAGGVVAYAGLDTVISDSFSTCMLDAFSTNAGNAKGDVCAGHAAATDLANSVVLYNCYEADKVGTGAEFLEKLNWGDCWTMADGVPKINFASVNEDYNVIITLNYGAGQQVNGNDSRSVTFGMQQGESLPFSYFLNPQLTTRLDEYIIADGGNVSYGYFFDKELQQKVPYGYMPKHDITLYIGFANYNAVAATYEYSTRSGRNVTLTLRPDGTYDYVDVFTFTANYVYDDKKLLLRDGYFARLSPNVVVDNNDNAQPWLNFEAYNFAGKLENGKLSIYDDNYFTKAEPLEFGAYTAPAANGKFLGTWLHSSTARESYTFISTSENSGTWTYSWNGNTTTGSYSVNNGEAQLGSKTAVIDGSGLLVVDGKYYSFEKSLSGDWRAIDYDAYLSLDGYGTGLAGQAIATIDGRSYYGLSYVKDGFFDEVTGNAYTHTILSGSALFGYFVYDEDAMLLTAMLYDESAGDFFDITFRLLDYYNGEWVGEESVDNVPFTIMDFNGLGVYRTEGDITLGEIIINGEEVSCKYKCTVNGWLKGTFTYKNVDYALETDGNGTVIISSTGESPASAKLYRKDEMSSLPLYERLKNPDGTESSDYRIYEFDGRGRLSKGGTMTVTSTEGNGSKTEYGYKITDAGTVANGKINIVLYSKDMSTEVGKIVISGSKFVLTLNSADPVNLDLYLPFADKDWAINALINSFHIGKFDLTPDNGFPNDVTYTATGCTFNGTRNLTFTYFPAYNYLYLSYTAYTSESLSGQLVVMYLLVLNDGKTLAISSYPYLVSGDFYYAAPCDEFFGGWTNTENGTKLTFDGFADGMAVGVVYDETNGLIYNYTRRFGSVYIWLSTDESVAYKIEYLWEDVRGENIYLKDGGSRGQTIRFNGFDVLNTPIFTAKDGGTDYVFNFDGTMTVGGESGTYLLDSVDGDTTTVLIRIGEEEYTVTVDHEDGTVTRN